MKQEHGAMRLQACMWDGPSGEAPSLMECRFVTNQATWCLSSLEKSILNRELHAA